MSVLAGTDPQRAQDGAPVPADPVAAALQLLARAEACLDDLSAGVAAGVPPAGSGTSGTGPVRVQAWEDVACLLSEALHRTDGPAA